MLKEVWLFLSLLAAVTLGAADRPNVILIMSDDQGYGDFGITGNHLIQTPHIDAMARQSFEFTRFYVNAVCSPTRASVMTGRQSYRTGVTDTWIGRSTMFAEEVTLAEILQKAGYGTGLFGKWHLGDNYPYRPMDQGFDQAIYHLGGGLGQPADPLENNRRYTDAILMNNGKKFQSEGFCCDVYFSEAMKWIETQKGQPFFAFIATNTPHSPFHDVPKKWFDYYAAKDLGKSQFKQDKGHPIAGGKEDNDRTAAIYAMVSNIDDNVGRLFKFLKDKKIEKDTLVIYMSDNGPHGYRYVGGFKGTKSQNTEGGLRSPIWFYYPQKFKAGGKNNQLAAHIDLMPTIAELCRAQMPKDRKIDGVSLLPALMGEKLARREAPLILQSHRGEKPERLNNASIYRDEWKLMSLPEGGLALFDMEKDPYAQSNIVEQHPEVVRSLIAEYDKMFEGIGREYPNMWAAKPVFIGTKYEKETHLSRQEWREQTAPSWNKNETNGTWSLYVKSAGKYKICFNLKEAIGPLKAQLVLNSQIVSSLSSDQKDWYEFPVQKLGEGPVKLQIKVSAGKDFGPWHVKISAIK